MSDVCIDVLRCNQQTDSFRANLAILVRMKRNRNQLLRESKLVFKTNPLSMLWSQEQVQGLTIGYLCFNRLISYTFNNPAGLSSDNDNTTKTFPLYEHTWGVSKLHIWTRFPSLSYTHSSPENLMQRILGTAKRPLGKSRTWKNAGGGKKGGKEGEKLR